MTSVSQEDGYRRVPFYRPSIGREEVSAVTRVVESGWLTSGPEAAALEQELEAFLQVDHCLALSSCTAALQAGLSALALPPRSRILIPTWTFAATALAAIHAGHDVVVCDVDRETLMLSPESVKGARNEVDAVIVVDIAGFPVATDTIQACTSLGLPVIRDAAHSIGGMDADGRPVGSDERIAATAFSFYATKNITSGEGGALATHRGDIADHVRSYRLHGLSRDAMDRYHSTGDDLYDLDHLGIKANFPDVLAAIGRVQLSRLSELRESRIRLLDTYAQMLADQEVPVSLHHPHTPSAHPHLAMVRLPESADRGHVRRSLAAAGVSTSVHFQPLHHLSAISNSQRVSILNTFAADSVAKRMLSLPFYAEMGVADIDYVCRALAATLRR